MKQSSEHKIETKEVMLDSTPKIYALDHFLISHGRKTLLLLGLVIAVTATALIVHDRSEKERLFRQCIQNAELHEYDGFYDRAVLAWEQAINAGTKLGNKSTRIADLHVNAAGAASCVDIQSGALARNHSGDKKIERLNCDRLKAARVQRRKHLLAALALYEKSDNSAADQISTLDGLLRDQMELKEQHYFLCSPTFVVPIRDRLDPQTGELEAMVKQGTNDLKCQRPGLGVTAFRKYLHQTMWSNGLQPVVDSFIHANSIDRTRFSDLISIYHEILYYTQIFNRTDATHFKLGQESLDAILNSHGYNPNSFSDRLRMADISLSLGDYHGAILEYLRCLGIRNDEKVRDKLYIALRKTRQVDYGDTDPLAENIALLKKKLKLEVQTFGRDSNRGQACLFNLGIANGIANNLAEAEVQLESIKHIRSDVDWLRAVHYALAEVYSKQGKCDEAVAKYRAGLALHPKDLEYASERIANAYICAGRYQEATQVINQMPKEEDRRF